MNRLELHSAGLCCVLALFCIISCKEVLSEVALIEGFEGTDVENFPMMDVSFIPLSGGPAVGVVRKIEMKDSSLIVLTDRDVRRYGLDGRYVCNISRKGRAKDEWLAINAMYVDGGGLVCIIDASGKRLIKFSQDGSFEDSSDAILCSAKEIADLPIMSDPVIVRYKY